MHSKCNHCKHLIESELVSEPHQHLTVLRQSASSNIYRCQLCNTLFEFTDLDIYLLDVVQSEHEPSGQNPSACA